MRDVRNRETEREHNKGKRERGTVIQGGRKRGNDRNTGGDKGKGGKSREKEREHKGHI